MTASAPPAHEALEGRHIALRGLEAADVDWLSPLLTGPDTFEWFLLRGTVPRRDQLVELVAAGSLATFCVTDRRSRPIGVTSLRRPDLRNGTAYLATAVDGPSRRLGLGVEAALVTLRYGFELWPLRKVYAEVLAPNLPQYVSGLGRRLFRTEVVLPGHELTSAGPCDLHILGVTREDWSASPAAAAIRPWDPDAADPIRPPLDGSTP